MKYRYLAAKPDYSDFAGGQVLLGLPGRVATPLRLMDELFQTGLAALRAGGLAGPVTLYDPCCGTAYHLAALAFRHRPELAALVASDAQAEVLAVAQRNLALLSLPGLDARIQQLQDLYDRFGKDSHRQALAAAARLRHLLAATAAPALPTHCFTADALDGPALRRHLAPPTVNLVLADVPYGVGSHWASPLLAAPPAPGDAPVIGQLLDALLLVIQPRALVCLLTGKDVKVAHARFQPLRRLKIGKRAALVLQRID